MELGIIATIVSITGSAFARSADGELRVLKAGDALMEGETLITPEGSDAELALADGSPLVVNDIAELAVTPDLMPEYAAGPEESAAQEDTVQAILAALEEGQDLSEAFEPTGASGASPANEGHGYVRLARILEETEEFDGVIGSNAADQDPILNPDSLISVDALDDQAVTNQGESVVIDVQSNDAFLEGAVVTAVSQGANGSVIINPDNTVTYIPNNEFYGTDTFTYTSTSVDGNGQDTAQVTVEVIRVADPVATITLDPVAGDDLVDLDEAGGGAIELSGSVGGDTRPGDIITLEFGDGTTFTTTVDDDLRFTLEVEISTVLSNDFVEGTVSGEDEFGNSYEAEAERSYDIEIPQVITAISNESEVEGDNLVFDVSLHPLSFYADQGVHTFELVDVTTSSADYGDISFSDGVINNNDGTITVPAGLTSFQVTVEGAQDIISEPTEAFDINIDGVTGIGEILDDDGTPTISISDAEDVSEGGVATFTISLSNPSSEEVTVIYNTVDGTAVAADGDYVAQSNQLVTIPAGSTEAQVQVQTSADDISELDESFTVQLSSPSNATIADNSGSATIKDTDDAPSLSISDAGNVSEGGIATFTVTLSNPSSQEVTVTYNTVDGTAVAGDGDYIAQLNQQLTFAAGETSKQIQIQTSDDNISELDEAFTVQLSNPSNANISDNSGSATIKDTDGLPTISIADAGDVSEGGVATFVVTLSNPSSQDITFTYNTVDGTAVAADGDYVAQSNQQITIPAGSTSAQIQIQTSDDNISELDEAFTVALSNPANATISDGSGSATIKDTDGLPTISISDAGDVTEGGVATFTVSLSNPSSQDITVVYNTVDGTAVAADGDYVAQSNQQITIPAGSTSAQIQIQTSDDNISELDEGFTVQLSNPSNATISDNSGSATIKDTDGAPTISISDAGNVSEGGIATFTVTLSNPSSEAVTVIYNTVDGTAVAADGDYVAQSNQQITFAAGETSKQIQIQTSDDNISELDEGFTVQLSNPSNATISDNSGSATIKDADGLPTISIADAGDVSEGGVATFIVSLSNPSSQDITVIYNTVDGTAVAADGDYVAQSNQQITIPAGSTSAQIQVQTSDDNISELDEAFTVALSNPSNATISDNSGSATIKDTDGLPSISISDAGDVGEGGVATFTVTLSNPSSQDVTLIYNTVDGTAVAADGDYVAQSNQQITIPAGSTSAQIQVQTSADDISELDEAFTVQLSNPSNATISDNSGSATIKDADGTPSISISDAGDVTEGGVATFTVTLSNPSSEEITVIYSTVDGTAVAADGDYVGQSNQQITFAAGETSKQIQIQTSDDNISELDEAFTVALSNPANATISDGSGSATIKDTDGLPTISISDAGDVSEGGVATFIVSLSNPSSQDITVIYNTVDGTAVAADGDYVAQSNQQITIPAGSTSAQIQIQTSDDNISELDEAFTVALSNPANATISDGSGSATIKDTDGLPTISISDAGDVTEGGIATFTVSLSNPSSQDITVIYNTVDGTAVAADGDYVAQSSQQVTIPAGSTSAQIQIQTSDDNISELDEAFTVQLSNPSNATISDNSGSATIKDTDGAPTISISDAGDVSEGGVATFTVTLSNPSSQEITVIYNTVDGTAVAGDGDYVAQSNQQITFAAGETSKQVQIQTSADNISELDEAFTVQLSNSSNASISDNSGSATIKDTDGAPTISISDAGDVDEGGVATFTVTLSNPSSQAISVIYNTVDGTAVAADGDYVAQSNQLITFAAGETSKQVQIQTSADNISELDEAFTVQLSSPSNATISDNSGSATIKDTDGLPTISISDAGNVTEGGIATFTVSLSNPSSQDITVIYNTVDGTAVAADGDYVAQSNQQITIPAGSASAQIQIQTSDDNISELDEAFTVQLSNPSNATIADNSGSATIKDTDGTPTISIADAGDVAEGGIATFTVTLSNPSSQAITVIYNTVDGTAVAGDGDYVAQSNQQITFAAGETSKQIQIQTSDDNISELDEAFTVQLSNPSNATISDNSGSATIKDTDGAPTISISDAGDVNEGGVATFTVTLSNPSSQAITVIYNTVDGTAVAADGDYVAQSNQQITFAAGETSKQIQIQTSEDNISELDEAFTVQLSNPSNATISDNSGSATIKDTDGAPAISISDAGNVTEGGIATFTVSLSNPSSQAVTVQYSTVDGSATVADGDYSANSNTITFLPGETSKQIQVQTLDDSIYEPTNEQFTVQLSNPTNATIADNSGLATILDNDADDPVLVSENNQAQVDESDLPNGNPGSPGNPVTTGTFTITTADGFGSMVITGQNGNATFGNLAALVAAIGSGVVGTGTVFNIGEHGTLELYGASGTPETGLVIDYAYTLTSAEDHLIAPTDPITLGASDGWDVFNLAVTDAGAGPDNSNTTGTIEIEIIDDQPVLHDPDSVLLVDGTDVEGVPINFNFAEVSGADGVGGINFNGVIDGEIARDIYGNTLSLDSDRLYTYLSDDGTTLWVATADPESGPAEIAFTVEIVGDTYTVRSNNGTVFNGSELATADLTTVGGGNVNPKAMVDPFGEQSDIDILITGTGGSGSSNDNTVNSNNGQLGVGTGQDIDFDSGDPAGDELRLEFGNLAGGETSIADDERITINRFLLPIESASNGSVEIEIFFHDPDNGFAQTAASFAVWDATGTTQLTYPDDLQGLNSDAVFMIIGDQNFDTVEISHGSSLGDGSFKVGEFSLTEFTDGEPIHLGYGIQGVDGDGDPVPGAATATEINFSLLSESDNVITATSGNDALLATEANDLFVWELADAGAPGAASADVITDFDSGGSDVLDVRDLLQLEDNGGVDSIGNLLEYLHVTESGGDTVLHISSAGGFSGGVFNAGEVDQTITLQGVDLTTGGTMTEIIQDMLSSGKLITD
jgi:Calx-beta domain/Bacterial Ig domain